MPLTVPQMQRRTSTQDLTRPDSAICLSSTFVNTGIWPHGLTAMPRSSRYLPTNIEKPEGLGTFPSMQQASNMSELLQWVMKHLQVGKRRHWSRTWMALKDEFQVSIVSVMTRRSQREISITTRSTGILLYWMIDPHWQRSRRILLDTRPRRERFGCTRGLQ